MGRGFARLLRRKEKLKDLPPKANERDLIIKVRIFRKILKI
jgi:hypothetical protein